MSWVKWTDGKVERNKKKAKRRGLHECILENSVNKKWKREYGVRY